MMKVLSVNKFYYKKGGSETYFFELNKLLKENNIEVSLFSMKDEKNYKNSYEKYFVENIDYSNMNLLEKIKNAVKIIYSIEAKNKINKLIKDKKPDIAHLNIFQHQLSPSIIHALKDNNVKIVNTVHDLKVICPNYKMLNSNGICEECKGGRYYNCVKHNCIKGSKLNSMVGVLEAYINKCLKSYSYVDKFICPSKFYKQKLIEFGLPKEKIEYLPNFVDVNKFTTNFKVTSNYFAYIGRLSEEKGIKTLIEAMKDIKNIDLYIVGDGPLGNELKEQAYNLNINNIKFLGFKDGNELEHIVREAKFIVVPSEWYENCPMTIIESMAYGKGVLGSDCGGIPELIKDKVNGLIFKNGDKEDLAEKINYLINNPEETKKMGVIGRKIAENEYDKKFHINRLIEIYDEVLNK